MTSLNYQKIVLVHPLGYTPGEANRDISRKTNIMPPLGLASIAAFLEKRNIEVHLIDCYAHPDALRQLKDILVQERPAFIGFSCTTSTFLDGVQLARFAKKELPHIQTIFGGAHVSALKEQLIESFPDVDFLVVGEGEETLYELITSQGENPDQIQGLAYRDATGPVFTGYRRKLLELDSLPFPAYEKLAGFPDAYKLPIFNYPKTPNSSCISSRGCPYACSYCDRSVFKRSFRYNSAQYLYDHLHYLNSRFGIRHVNFYDDQFTFNRQRVADLCSRLIASPLKISFNCAVRADHIDHDLLRIMKEAGCWMISLGIETGDEDLLSQHRQNVNIDMLADKIRLIHQTGIRVKGLLMMGLPGESEQSIKKSMEYVFSLPIDDINISKFTPFPGSPLYKEVDKLGTFTEDWVHMDCMDFLFIPNGMTKKRLDELFIRFYKSHYTRPKVLLGYAAMLWKSPDSWFRFTKDLGSFLRFARTNQRIETL